MEVLGVGSAVLDHMLSVSEEYLDTIPGEKWGSEPIEHKDLVAIIEKSGKVPKQLVGGSAANAVKGLASLGHDCGLISKIGEDGEAEKIVSDLESIGVAPFFATSSKPTAQVVCLITPDGKRTMRYFMGASGDLQSHDLDVALFSGIKLLHIEAYTLYSKNLTRKAMEIAKAAGASVSFDLSSFEIVENYRQSLLELIESHVDVLFANADEASALTHLSPEHACKELTRLSKTVVIMMGEEGCCVGNRGKAAHYPAYPVKPIDTTGAGDLFASGFLHGWLRGEPMETCAHYGALLGREIVQVVGAEISQEKWKNCQIPCK